MERLEDLVGRRVALRHRLGSGLLTDAVGELTVDGAALVVQTRRGPVRVARPDVVAARAIPPAVPRRPSWAAVARLENLCADAWPARVDEPLGAWRLRAAGGFTGRANAALAVGDPGIPVPAALEAVRAFADGHGVPPRVHVPVGSPWDRAVAAAGWVLDAGHEAGAEVAVLVADVDRLAAHHSAVALTERPDDAWWALALGREPTPDERWVLDPGSHAVPEPTVRTAFGLVAGRGRDPGRRRRRPPAPVPAHRPPRGPPRGHRHRADGGRRGVGPRAGRAVGRAAGGAAQHGGAGVLRRAGRDGTPPLPLPGAAGQQVIQ